MKEQNYKNHTKYSVLHHFILLPLLAFLWIFGLVKGLRHTDENLSLTWLLFATAIFLLFVVLVFLRQHYALGNQNRIVRLEFRLRYFELFGRSAKEVEDKLDFGQIAALRFAGDEEFKNLLQRAIEDKLKPDDIKKQIKNWQADNMRV